MDECARLAPLFGGISHDRLDREGALHWPCRSPDDPGEAHLYRHRFATADGRAHLAALRWLPPGEQPSAEYPFALITGRRLVHYNAGTMTRRTGNLALVPHETIDIHPNDAARLDIRDDQPVRVRSDRATITAAARITDDVAPGQLFLAFHFPDTPANALTSQHGDRDTWCPEYKITAVTVDAIDDSP
jgi:formate dehydrogenase major subunit